MSKCQKFLLSTLINKLKYLVYTSAELLDSGLSYVIFIRLNRIMLPHPYMIMSDFCKIS